MVREFAGMGRPWNMPWAGDPSQTLLSLWASRLVIFPLHPASDEKCKKANINEILTCQLVRKTTASKELYSGHLRVKVQGLDAQKPC